MRAAAWLAFGLFSADVTCAQMVARGRHAMVVTREAHATDAALAVLQAGGNAVDAAVAAGFVLAVTHPAAGNLGGGGFLLVRFHDNRAAFLDFRERAPLAASRNMYLDAEGTPTRESLTGWRAAAVPGTVRGLELAHRKWGTRPWAELLAPAIRLASHGFLVSYALARSLRQAKVLGEFPESRRIFQRDGRFYEPGDRLVQPELARTLERLARHGARDFYEGETARRLAAAMQAHGGLITLEDLRRYEALERPPLRGSYKGWEILTAPPPSSGGVGLLQMLAMLETTGYEKAGAGSAAVVHFLTEVMRRYYADRSRWLGDPDFARIPVQELLDPVYVAARRRTIDPERATPSESLGPGELPTAESSETTHYSIVDAQGNAVAVTYTLNGSYGCGVTVPGLGFLLNNEMDDFAVKPGAPNYYGLIQGEANAIAPGKRPLSSMTPTIVLRNGRLAMVLGSPGGPRIITTVLQVFLNLVDFNLDLWTAVLRPRFHHQWKPDAIVVEPGFSPDTLALLRAKGHRIEEARSIGEVAAIAADEGWWVGVADPRAEGKASGF
ncbi:MAG: gamma-glutamyltransferase [Bryobacterales bacterium]|nr:gamma-glutamyltransferase [Bryobacteraceae bacterium]MDW8356131.1 gamma-glutamyltransferase [Bryobacterales bacterium]